MNPPVPVLFLIHSLGHGGSERQLALCARNLDRSRFSPHVATVAGGFRVDDMRASGIPVFKLPLHGLLKADTLSVARLLRDYIRQHRIRILHAFDFGTAPFGVGVGRTCRGLIVLSSQRFYMDSVSRKTRALVLASHWMAHGVVTNSAALKDYLHREYKYPLSRIEVCPNGLDADSFRPEPRERLNQVADASLVIGTVCVLRPEKNLAQLLEAFAKVRAGVPGARLLIVGSGSEEQMLKSLAARLGLEQAAVFLPSTRDVAAAMRSIDIFVHPSLTEGMPNAVMEAMACGCSVIATRVGGSAELIEHGVHGLLVDPGDLAGLTTQIAAIVNDSALRLKLGAAAAHRMREEFSIDAASRKMEEIYTRFLSRYEPER